MVYKPVLLDVCVCVCYKYKGFYIPTLIVFCIYWIISRIRPITLSCNGHLHLKIREWTRLNRKYREQKREKKKKYGGKKERGKREERIQEE